MPGPFGSDLQDDLGLSDVQLSVAVAVAVLPGSLMGGLLIVWHTRGPRPHWIEGLVFVVWRAIVWLGVAVSH